LFIYLFTDSIRAIVLLSAAKAYCYAEIPSQLGGMLEPNPPLIERDKIPYGPNIQVRNIM